MIYVSINNLLTQFANRTIRILLLYWLSNHIIIIIMVVIEWQFVYSLA